MPAYTLPPSDLLTRLKSYQSLLAPYPPIETFSELNFTQKDLIQHLNYSKSIALNLHIPFCKELCNFCNCNIVVTRQYGLAAQYAEYLRQEIQWYRDSLREAGKEFPIPNQIYVGGGTPTFLLADDLRRVLLGIDNTFGTSKSVDRDYCIEIDPRSVDHELISLLKSLGFNRLHFGLEDFSNDVQHAINRKYTYERIKQSTSIARAQGIHSISVDMTYGLPEQSVITFINSLKQILRLVPSRIVLQRYTHNPKAFLSQQAIKSESLPAEAAIYEMQTFAINYLKEVGFQAVGSNCFVHNEDPLSDATKNGRIHWTYRGYTKESSDTVLGFGLSAVSTTPSAIWQNQLNLRNYTKQIRTQGHSVYRGTTLSQDDQIRRDITQKLLCNIQIDKERFKSQWKQNFDTYFAQELAVIQKQFGQQLLINNDNELKLTTSGQWVANQLATLFQGQGGINNT
jgi:oxygen-independent coproporphyrinogen-3 oxidase